MTKKVRIFLSALTRLEYSCVVEVPDSWGKEELDELTQRVDDRTKLEDYHDDYDYWENQESEWEEMIGDVASDFRVVVNEEEEEDYDVLPVDKAEADKKLS